MVYTNTRASVKVDHIDMDLSDEDVFADPHPYQPFPPIEAYEKDGDEEISREHVEVKNTKKDDAKELVKKIKKNLSGLDITCPIDEKIVHDIITGAFWSGTKSKVFLLNKDQALVQFVESDMPMFLASRFGAPATIDKATIKADDEDKPKRGRPKKNPEDEELNKLFRSAVWGPITQYIKYMNQREKVEYKTDMFRSEPIVTIAEDLARVVLTHKPFHVNGKAINPAVIADYREHFPQIDDVLDFIIAGRFALDRKRSYLWLLADSDWGKGLFTGVLQNLHTVVPMSVKEIEGIFEGKPAGRRPEDFKRSFVIAIDEFKTVKSEIKQLQSTMELAPKFGFTCTVEIFTKLFTSAENVASLVGEHGVEDQFANRMSIIEGRGSITTRPLFDANKPAYVAAIEAYIASRFNTLIDEYVSLGIVEAQKKADVVISEFLEVNGLGNKVSRLSANLDEIATYAVKWIRSNKANNICVHEGLEYLVHPGSCVEAWISENIDHSEKSTISKKKTEIYRVMSDDGRGIQPHRFDYNDPLRQRKAILLKSGNEWR